MRAAANRAKFPVCLADHFANSRTDLFNMWLEAGKDWDKTKVVVERSQEARNKSPKGWSAIQGKTLREKYSAEKFEMLVNKRKSQGLFYEDDDFPGDLDEA